MRRGLKRRRRRAVAYPHEGFKPIPDEEGTETGLDLAVELGERSFKPIPAEEGTETESRPIVRIRPRSFKPIPDEEGTETFRWILRGSDVSQRFKPIRSTHPSEVRLSRLRKSVDCTTATNASPRNRLVGLLRRRVRSMPLVVLSC